jgi:uncharacterized protein (TIGR03437 family)
VVNAASGKVYVSPGSAVAAFGQALSAATGSAPSLPLPTVLAGLNVQVTDSAGAVRLAPILLVSPTQVNFILPADTAVGTAAIALRNGPIPVAIGYAMVQQPAPGIFSAGGEFQGIAAATAFQKTDGDRQISFPVFQCNQILQVCWAIPIPLSAGRTVYLALFGTGISGGHNITVTVGGQAVPVLYAGPQGSFPGLDQVNIQLAPALSASGLTYVVTYVDGFPANAVQVVIQ